jgi:hypothetical protein
VQRGTGTARRRREDRADTARLPSCARVAGGRVRLRLRPAGVPRAAVGAASVVGRRRSAGCLGLVAHLGGSTGRRCLGGRRAPSATAGWLRHAGAGVGASFGDGASVSTALGVTADLPDPTGAGALPRGVRAGPRRAGGPRGTGGAAPGTSGPRLRTTLLSHICRRLPVRIENMTHRWIPVVPPTAPHQSFCRRTALGCRPTTPPSVKSADVVYRGQSQRVTCAGWVRR